MNEKLAVRQEGSLAPTMSQEQIDLIKNTVARGATNDELKLFLYTAQRTGLDPLTKQIHFIKRRVWNKRTNDYDEVGTIQTGIDGYRVVASRNGLAGIEDAVFDDESGAHPNKATVTVYRMVEGQRVSFTASARWKEYAQLDHKTGDPTGMWKKMPYLMLAKVAEALALRKAFPNDLTGVYTNEEMQQADTDTPSDPVPVQYEVKRATPAADDEEAGSTIRQEGVQTEIDEYRKRQIKDLMTITLQKPARKEVVKELTGLEMKPDNYEAVIKKLNEIVDRTDPLATAMTE
jgi:phage recombination protein Bet